MTGLLSITSALGGWIWETTWQAAILALLIFVLQLVLGRRLTARWRHALWLLVLVRLSLPALPESRVSVYNWAPAGPSLSFGNPSRISPVSVQPVPSLRMENKVSRSSPPASAAGWQDVPWFPLIWLVGAVTSLTAGLFAYLVFWRRVRRLKVIPGSYVQEFFQSVKDRPGMRHAGLLVTGAVDAPVVCGFIRPVILLPENIGQRLSMEELRLVLLHELTHVKRLDVFTAWLFWFFGALHWFNPVLRLAFWRARLDRELACDETVLAETSESHTYGSALIRLWQDHVRTRRPAGVIGIFEDRTEPFRRMKSIAAFRRPSSLQTTAGLIALSVLVVCALTGKTSASAQKVADQKNFVTSLVEAEFQMISVPNSSAGQILSRDAGLHSAVLDLLNRGIAQIYDISKIVARNGARTYAVGLARVDIEPTLSSDLQTIDLNMSLESKKSKLILAALLPAGQILCLGSFDDPRTGSDATVFVFARWKIVEL